MLRFTWGAIYLNPNSYMSSDFFISGNAMLCGNIDKRQIKIKRKNNFGGSNGNYRSCKTNRKIT